MKRIDPHAAAALLASGATLIDIRERDEYAREHIPGARHLPLALLSAGTPASVALPAGVIVFHCRSGMRTAANCDALARAAGDACEPCILDGGLDAWKHAGLPVTRDGRQPLELMRQVQIAAGSLVVAGVVLGATVAPAWHLLSAAVGAGLVFAGASGFCGLARLLLRMPWNRALRG